MLKYRVVSGVALIAVFSLLTFWNSIVSSILFILLACFFLAIAILEFFSLTRELGYPGYPLLTITGGIGQFFMIGLECVLGIGENISLNGLESFVILCFMIILFLRVFREPDLNQGVRNLIVSLGGFLYLSWTLSFMIKIYFSTDEGVRVGPVILFYVIIVTKCSDIGGYFSGKLSARRSGGNHKLVPRLSPQKSWEGLIGGIVLSIGVSLLLVFIIGDRINASGNVQPLTIVSASVLAIALSIIGLVGDLSVSVIKRAARQKDAGAVLPGFGGILDLLDSLIFVSPFCFCVVTFFR